MLNFFFLNYIIIINFWILKMIFFSNYKVCSECLSFVYLVFNICLVEFFKINGGVKRIQELEWGVIEGLNSMELLKEYKSWNGEL